MKKVKLECWWTDTKSLNNRLQRQFITSNDNIELVESNPDYTIVFGRTNWESIETPKDRTFYFSQEPLWSYNEIRGNLHDYCSKIFIANKEEYPDRPEYIETLLPMFYGGHGEFDHREEWDWSTRLRTKRFKKSKKISIIVRKDASQHFEHLSNPLTNRINYSDRTFFGIELSKNPEIDIYGLHWENNGSNIKGEVWNKHVGLDDYLFSIGCENTIQKNYISEKFWDIILTDGIPIYLGCSNIKDYISNDSFIYLNNMSIDEMVKKVNDVLNNIDDYHNLMYKNILELKEEFFINPAFNIWERIKKEINEN